MAVHGRSRLLYISELIIGGGDSVTWVSHPLFPGELSSPKGWGVSDIHSCSSVCCA